MFRDTAWFCFIGIISLRMGSEARILSFPRNAIALVNERVEFPCSTDSDELLRWSVTSAGATKSIALFTHGNLDSAVESKYRIDTSRRYNLMIDSVDFSYAGKYTCTEEPSGLKVEAELAVIDSHPSCQANASNTDNSVTVVANNYLWMQCSLSFSGNVNLRTSWIRNSTGEVLYHSLSNRSHSMIVIRVNSSDNGETFTFKATIRQENNSRQIVVMWNYTVEVLYKPKNLVVRPLKTVYVVGDRLECSADGNPSPSYEWTDNGTNKIIHGSVLTIEDYMRSNQSHTFRCTAYNTLAGLRKHISETVTFRVTGSTLKPDDTSELTTLLLVAVSVIAIAVITFCFIPFIGYVCLIVYNKIKCKRRTMPILLEEETTIANEHSQRHGATDQNLC